MAELGRLTAVFDADTRKFDAGFRSVEKSIAGVAIGLSTTTTSVNRLTGELSPATAGLGRFSGSLGQTAGVSVIAATAIAGVVTGLFELAKRTAEYEGQFQDLNDQTGIGVENLSALKLAFDESGGSIESGSAALSKYLRGVSEANTGNEKLRQKFLDVGFTVDDLNASYGNSDKAIEILVRRVGGYSNSQDRLNALQKLGVRNAKELNGAIVQMNGDLVKFREEAERLGLVITPEQARAADDFDESLEILRKQIKGMSFSIAHQYMPEIQGAINDVSTGLSNNRGAWASWGNFVKTEIRGVRVAAAFLTGMFEGMQRTGGLLGLSLGHGVADAILKSRQIHLEDSVGVSASAGAGIFRTKGLEDIGDGSGKKKGKSDAEREAEQAAKRRLQYMTDLQREVSKLADELTGADTSTREYAVQQEILNGLLKDAPPHMQQMAIEAARTHDEIAKLNGLTRQFNDFIKEQAEMLASLKPGMDTHLGQAIALVDSLEKQGAVLDKNKRFWMLFDASLLQVTEDAERLNRVLQSLPNTADIFTVPEFDPRTLGPQIESQIGAPPRDLAELRAEMELLASDLMGMFDRAIFDGIKGGGMRGLQSLTLGFLDLINQVIQGELKRALAEALSGAAGGGGWLAKILGALVGVGTAAVGGGGTTWANFKMPTIGRASGGPVSAGMPYLVHKDELIVPTRDGMVYNKQQQRGLGSTTVNHFNITVPRTHQSARQRRSQRELAESIAGFLRA